MEFIYRERQRAVIGGMGFTRIASVDVFVLLCGSFMSRSCKSYIELKKCVLILNILNELQAQQP